MLSGLQPWQKGPRLRFPGNYQHKRMSKESRNEPRINSEEILAGILQWVNIESPSDDQMAVNHMADQVQDEMRDVGTSVERIPGRDGFGDILIARAPWNDDRPGILVLSHLDTVHPIGTLESIRPVAREGDVVFGPGIYDMKGGAYLAYYALRHLIRLGRTSPLPVTFLFVPEEEVGSHTSREHIERLGLENKYVLVTEPARDGGKVVTSRKGSADFEVTVSGRAAHAGAWHQDGRSAIAEMARQIPILEDMTDYERNITVSVGVIEGGTFPNVVPAQCKVQVDMRVPNAQTADEMCERVLGLTPIGADTEVKVTGGMNRPGYEKDAGISALFEHTRALAADIGFELEDTSSGGVSDGNFTAALGIPTLDGLGVDGQGAHTNYEQMYYSSLAPRAELWVRLLSTLE